MWSWQEEVALAEDAREGPPPSRGNLPYMATTLHPDDVPTRLMWPWQLFIATTPYGRMMPLHGSYPHTVGRLTQHRQAQPARRAAARQLRLLLDGRLQ